MSGAYIKEYVRDILDCKIGYCTYGHGPINMLMICGGVGCYKKDWPEHVISEFDENLVTIVCIDPPGYGVSRPPERKASVTRCLKDAQYCLELMKQIKKTPFTVVGWSEGSRTAIHVGGQGNELVEKMVLIAGSTKVDQRGVVIFRGMKNTDQWLPNARESYLEHYSEDFLRKQWGDICDLVIEVYDMLGGVFLAHDVLPKLKCPVLLINGAHDKFIMDPKFIMERVQDVRLITHAQANHDVHIKYPKWFVQTVCDFMGITNNNNVITK
uniref:AB hydrolase-1 domain-containing protein n=1 Tax=Rhabditophanes sp. KR3021 TaxID=114890 RepID=A0AC35TLD9_9BILA